MRGALLAGRPSPSSPLFFGRSQDFCCEACGCSMRTALLPLTSNSNPSAEDHKAKELAQQINFKVRTLHWRLVR